MPSFSLNPDLVATTSAPIPTAGEWATRYNGEHGPLIKLTQGVPSTPPNKAFLDRLAKESSDPSNTGYGALLGEPGLRKALAKDVSDVYGGDVQSGNIAITAGCNMAAQIVLQTLAKAGDEVILPSPWYFDHEMAMDMLGIHLIPLACQPDPHAEGYVPKVEEGEALITTRTKAIILVTPNNPTGAVYSPSLIRSFFDLCQRHHLALIIDETYRDFLPSTRLPNQNLFSLPNWSDTLISLYSFSKSFAIPGHRVGAIIASSSLINTEIVKVMDALLVCAPVPAQKVLEWAIPDPGQKEWRNERRDELLKRGKLFSQVVNAANARIARERSGGNDGDNAEWQGWQIDGLGAYYAFLRHPYGYIKDMNQEKVARGLGEKVGVSCLPASFFGQGQTLSKDKSSKQREKGRLDKEHLRISIANVFDEGIRLIEDRLVIFDRLVRDKHAKFETSSNM